MVVGTADRLRQLDRRLDGFPEAGLFPVTTVTLDRPLDGFERPRARALLERGDIDQVLITDAGAHALLEAWASSDLPDGVDVDCALVLPAAAGSQACTARIGDLGVVPLGRLMPPRPRMWSKRLFDILLAGSMLVLLAPVLVMVSLAIWMYDRGPVFYRQWRVGLDGRQFRIWKFRSMVPGADSLTDKLVDANIADGLLFKVPDDPRVTPVGALIRRLSIDELPQFFNVVTGDMSLVGPRPLPVDPSEFDGAARRRHHVRPGITGLWQVEGGHVVDYDDMIKLDLAYIDGWSLRQDIALLLKTVPAVLVRRSAY
jgi:lipopolysaccharide/colanic/teichoic acid biosynthesis glycosyltransferase